MFTLVKDGEQLEFDELVDVLFRAEVNDPVYVPGRGWMAVPPAAGLQVRPAGHHGRAVSLGWQQTSMSASRCRAS